MRTLILLILLIFFLVSVDYLMAEGESDLARQSQNPVSDLISVPFQNNINFNLGPNDRTQNILNIQPVAPFHLTENWNLITRTIAPVIYQPDILDDSGGEFGLGDINTTWFLSPRKPGKLIWGVGPILSLPTATDEVLGTEKWSAGPSAVLLTMQGRWVMGAIASNIWSFAGDNDRDKVNQFLLQYFINYNFPSGWYLTSSPINTANWEADSDDRWIVPLGGGFGKVFRLGQLPINASTQGFYNVEHPDLGPEWQLRFQLTFLFPKG